VVTSEEAESAVVAAKNLGPVFTSLKVN